ncbi:cell division protein FtsA [Patescibacteria group bacterium]|nr:cell division protein FtsA [Patescibacteria group bacterium]
MQHSKIINAIDIGSSKITTIIGQYFSEEDRHNIVAVSSTPTLGFRKGQIINLEQAIQTITKSIESAERMAGFQIKSAIISIAADYIESINSQGVVAINAQNEEIDNNDIHRVLEAAKAISIPNNKEIIHIIPRKFTVDGQEGILDPLGMSGIRLEVESHLVLASSPAIKNIEKCFDEIGVKIDSLVYSGLSTAKLALTNTEKELGVALVDIGGSITTLTIFNEGSPSYSKVIPIGANNVTNDLAIGLRFSIDDAEKIKIKLNKITKNQKFEDEIDLSHFGLNSSQNQKISIQTSVAGIIKPRLKEIFDIINAEIENSGLRASIPAGIVLTGGGALTINAQEICADTIPLPTRIAIPKKVGGLIDDILNPAYTSSIGLLMYGLEENSSTKKTKNKGSFNNIFSKIKSFIQPLLP